MGGRVRRRGDVFVPQNGQAFPLGFFQEPVGDIVLPNSTSLGDSIAGGGGVVIKQDAQCLTTQVVIYFVEPSFR